MPFAPTNISVYLKSDLENFAKNHDFIALYKEYCWGTDSWQNGFLNILRLEIEISKTAKNNLLRKENIFSVVRWGNLRNIQRIKCPETLVLPLYENAHLNEEIAENPLKLLSILQENIERLGPTYLSKVLRFALPSEFGAIDTRIIRVVGNGDLSSKQQNWLSLKVRNDGYGWYIPKNQPAWPQEYSKWINILRFFAYFLNNSGILCPHPEGFLRNDLRKRDIWMCADVEMALFSYASKQIV